MYDGVYLIINLLLLFGLLGFIYGPYQHLIINICRQRLFVVRDEIFDLALEGRMDFADPRYRTIRSSIETDIRYLHSTTLPRIVLAALFMKPSGGQSVVGAAIDAIEDPELRVELRSYRNISTFIVMGSAGLRSPFILTLLVPVFVYKFFVGDLYAIFSRAKTDIEKHDDHRGSGGLPMAA